jgi:hypothetical protein
MKELNKNKGVWNEDAEKGQNPVFRGTFWGFLGFSEEEKGLLCPPQPCTKIL